MLETSGLVSVYEELNMEDDHKNEAAKSYKYLCDRGTTMRWMYNYEYFIDEIYFKIEQSSHQCLPDSEHPGYRC